MRGGWFAVFREDFDRLTQEEGGNATLLWLTLLADAAYETGPADTRYGRIELRPGQLFCSRRRLAKRLGIPPSSVRNLLARWHRIGRITLGPLPVANSDQREDQLPTLVTIND